MRAGARWLQAREAARSGAATATLIGIKGLSYGGLNVLQAISRDSELFAAGAASAPVFNWRTTDRGYDPNLDAAAPTNYGFRQLPYGVEPSLASPAWPAAVEATAALSWASSPSGHLDAATACAAMLLHGDLDDEVS